MDVHPADSSADAGRIPLAAAHAALAAGSGWRAWRAATATCTARAAPFDLTFTGPGADVITRHIYRLGAHEPVITRYLLEHVRLGPGDVALDIGANIGWYSVLLNRLSDAGRAHLRLRAGSEDLRLLHAQPRRQRRHARDRAQPRARGRTRHRAAAPLQGQQQRPPHASSGARGRWATVQVRVDTLEPFWQAQQLGERPIRFMKIDVEGFEYFVLRGAGELLGRCDNVLLEYSPAGLSLAGLEPGALIELLRRARLRRAPSWRASWCRSALRSSRRCSTQHGPAARPAALTRRRASGSAGAPSPTNTPACP